jgi:hypothetical protein
MYRFLFCSKYFSANVSGSFWKTRTRGSAETDRPFREGSVALPLSEFFKTKKDFFNQKTRQQSGLS